MILFCVTFLKGKIKKILKGKKGYVPETVLMAVTPSAPPSLAAVAMLLKVHKRENFLGCDFELYTFL
jgi:hypothetical protein